MNYRIVSLLLLAHFWASTAGANLLVYPTRVVLSDTERVGTLALRHTGAKPETYKISLVFYRMKSDGTLEVATPKDDEKSALNLLRFSPRKTKLVPNLEQVVRVMLGGGSNIPDGDYRAHIHFEPVSAGGDGEPVSAGGDGEPVSAGGDGEPAARETASDESGMKMELRAKVAIAVPVVFRKGKPTSSVTLSAPTIQTTSGKPAVGFEMAYTGNAFPYGDFFAIYTPPGGTPTTIGALRGVSCYTPKRKVNFQLDTVGDLKLDKGSLKIEFREADVENPPLLASAEATLP